MNLFVEDRFVEKIRRLALGLEPIDALRLLRMPHPLDMQVEQPPKAGPRPPIDRHASCLHTVIYYSGLIDQIVIRVFERQLPDAPRSFAPSRFVPRRFVPRRFSIPLHTEATADANPLTDRIRRPFLFPGAGYDIDSGATGLRGSVTRGGQPMRWARVEAALPGSGVVVGRAHGDDRGEFLLVIGPNAIPVGDLVNPLTLQVSVFGPITIPVPATPDLPSQDPIWDLPVETMPGFGVADTVSTGEALPTGYTAKDVVNVDFSLGELRSGLAAFVIT